METLTRNKHCFSSGGKQTRRRFLKHAAGAYGVCAFPFPVLSTALGKGQSVPPGDRVTLGFIGVGMMGRGHVWTALSNADVQVLGVCDVDTWRREQAKANVEKSYKEKSPRSKGQVCAAYNDLRDLLARTDIDAVVVATGDRWHIPASVLAVQAGKDVYCEKPMSKTIREASTMVEYVRRYQRIFQTGLQQRSTPHFQKACELVQTGHIGKVSHVYVCFPGTSSEVNLQPQPVPKGLDWDLWLGPSPWRPYNGRFHIYGQPPHVVPWHFCSDFGGGNLTSNAVHAFDVVQWGLGMDDSGPVEIIPPETGKVPCLTYRYANGVTLQVQWKLDPKTQYVPEGWDVNTRIQNFGALFVGDKGWIHVGRENVLTSHPKEIVEQHGVKSPNISKVKIHHRDWLQSIRSRKLPSCDVAKGAHSTIVAHLGCIAHWTGRALAWDPGKEVFIDDEQANRLTTRTMRSPWRL